MAVSARGAWREWVSFFLRGVAEQARDAVVRAKRLQDLQSEWRHRLVQARTSGLAFSLVDALFDSPVMTIPQAQRQLDVKQYHSARRHIRQLVKLGILKPVDESTYGKTFVAAEILRLISEGG
jgi:Fic family protein